LRLEEKENIIVNLEKARKEYLKLELPYQQEKAALKTEKARIGVRVSEIDQALLEIKDKMDQNSIDLSLAKKEFWSLKNELGC